MYTFLFCEFPSIFRYIYLTLRCPGFLSLTRSLSLFVRQQRNLELNLNPSFLYSVNSHVHSKHEEQKRKWAEYHRRGISFHFNFLVSWCTVTIDATDGSSTIEWSDLFICIWSSNDLRFVINVLENRSLKLLVNWTPFFWLISIHTHLFWTLRLSSNSLINQIIFRYKMHFSNFKFISIQK